MALVTPEFLQTKKYSARRMRAAISHSGAIQAGIWNYGDFAVSQKAGGAAMSVDVAAGYALVSANDPGNLGLYHVQNDATVNVAVNPSHATLPRIDQVYLLVNDSTDGGDANDTPQLLVAQGTATSGVTLDAPGTSRATLPTGSLKLADLLIPANSDAAGVTTANISQSNGWARGFVDIDLVNQTTDFDVVGLEDSFNGLVIDHIGRVIAANMDMFVRPNGDTAAGSYGGVYHDVIRDSAGTTAHNTGGLSDTGYRLFSTMSGNGSSVVGRAQLYTKSGTTYRVWGYEYHTKMESNGGGGSQNVQTGTGNWLATPVGATSAIRKLTFAIGGGAGRSYTGRIRLTRF